MAIAERVAPVLKEGRGFIEEFKAFIRRGNVVDLAVAVIIGAAFGKIVSSLVADVVMPPIGLALSNVDFKDLAVTLKHEVIEPGPDGKPVVTKPAVALAYGKFLQSLIDFLLIALCVFVMVKIINRVQGDRKEAPKPPPEEILLLTEIRDLLKSQAKPAIPAP
jgi:large conductance mechanosensitive channel